MKKERGSESVIARFFAYLTQLVYHVLEFGFIGRLFTSYKKVNRSFRSSAIVSFARRWTQGGGKLYRALRRSLALAIDRSLLRRGLELLLKTLLLCSLRTIGLFLVTSGAYTVIVYWLFSVVWGLRVVGVMSFFAGLAALALGLLLMFFDVSLGWALSHGFFFAKVIAPIFGLSDERFKDIARSGKQGYAVAIPLGMLVGSLASLLPPQYVLVGALLLLISLMVLSLPETGVLCVIAFLPFSGLLPNGKALLAFAVGLSIFSYFAKILRGNRMFHMDVQDFAVLLMLLFCVFASPVLTGAGMWQSTLFDVLLIAFYFLAVNTVATPQWLTRCRAALILSATLASLLGIGQFILAVLLNSGSGLPIYRLCEAVRAGLLDSSTFAYFLVIAFPFALCAFVDGKRSYRLPAGFACVSIVTALVLTWVQSAWIAVLSMLVVFLLIRQRRAFPFVLLGAGGVSVAFAMLPGSLRSTVLHVLRLESGAVLSADNAAAGDLAFQIFFKDATGSVNRFYGVLRMIFGLGYGGFEQFCALYASISPELAVRTFNFWVFRLLEGGVVGVLLPVFLFFMILQNCFSILHAQGTGQRHGWPVAGIVMMIGVLIFGFFRYSWYDPAALTAFFAAAALIGADARYERQAFDEPMQSEEFDPTSAELDYY